MNPWPSLVVDCGNSAYKLCAVSPDGNEGLRLDAPQRIEHLDELSPWSSPPQSLVVLPGNRQRLNELLDWWHHHGPSGPLWVLGDALPAPDMGQYATCGLDRVCAGVAALQTGGSAVVVDCGTATTISAWQAEAEQPFQGGLILPGPLSCVQGLQRSAPALPRLEQLPTPEQLPARAALAHSTPEALAHAMALGYPAMVSHCVQEVMAASGIQRLVYSGDGWPAVQPPASWQHLPYAPLLGLAIIARPVLDKEAQSC